MRMTVKEIKRYTDRLPDEAEVWMEYPKRYGLVQPEVIETIGKDTSDEFDVVECMSVGTNAEKSRLYIFHHY